MFASQLGGLRISTRQWTLAGRHRAAYGAGAVPEAQARIQRLRVSQDRLDYTMDFLSSPMNLQLLAFGEKQLKLENGESITIGAALRTTLKSALCAAAKPLLSAAPPPPPPLRTHACHRTAQHATALLSCDAPRAAHSRRFLPRAGTASTSPRATWRA